MARVHRIVTWLLPVLLTSACLVASAALAACEPDPPKAPHAMRPLPEPRAAELIARAFREAGLQPEADRYLRVSRHDKKLRLEVAAAGHRYGVAYLTADDWSAFGDALPPRPTDDSLAIGTAEANRFLVLFADDYAEDDMTGDEHTATTIAADRRLLRDVRDFLHRAQQQGWP